MKKLMIGISILVVGVIVLFVSVQIKPFGASTSQSSDTSLIQERIVELSELTTLKYEYTNVIISRTNRNVPLTDIKFAEAIKLIEYSGYLKAGSDLSELDVSQDEVSKQLFVRIPKSQILDNVAETEKVKVEDVKGNIFSDYPTQIVFDEINTEKQKLEEEKISQGFLMEADKRTEELLTSFLSSNGYNDIVIEFY